MNQKLQLALPFLFLFGFGVSRIQSQNSMLLKFNDATQKTTLLTTLKKISFADGNIVLNYVSGTSDAFAVSLVQKLQFSTASGTQDLFADAQSLLIYPNPVSDFISLKNAPKGALNVTIYRLDGSILLNSELSSDAEQINVSGLIKGFYLLKVNNKAFKFTKK